jgi:hypothetical protein
MANFSQSLVAGAEPTICSAVGYNKFIVNVPSTSLYSVVFYGDNSGSVVLATVAPGAVASFGAPGYFWYECVGPTTSAFTVAGVATPSYELSAAGATVTNTATETVSATTTIPANLLTLGSTIRIRVQGISTAVNSTNTHQYKVRIGPTTLTGQVVLDSTAVNCSANAIFTGEFYLVVRGTPGAAVACVGYGTENVLNSTAIVNTNLASTNFATNGALIVEATITQSVANAGNSARVDFFEVTVQ